MNLKVAEVAVQFFVTNDKPNVAGLVLAGSADFKTELSQSDLFDQRLRNIILSVVDVSYGEQFYCISLYIAYHGGHVNDFVDMLKCSILHGITGAFLLNLLLDAIILFSLPCF